jgi:hypothetical protein
MEMRYEYRILFEKPKGMRRLGRSRRRWEDDIKTGSGAHPASCPMDEEAGI